MDKYIIRNYGPYTYKEVRTKNLLAAIRIKKEMKSESSGYCCIIKIPFSSRHPDFPLWFSLISLFLVIISRLMG